MEHQIRCGFAVCDLVGTESAAGETFPQTGIYEAALHPVHQTASGNAECKPGAAPPVEGFGNVRDKRQTDRQGRPKRPAT